MTELQRKVLDYIHEIWHNLGRTPSFREIARHCGHKSPQSAHSAVNDLIDMGYLCRGVPRTQSSYSVVTGRDLSSITTDALKRELKRRGEAA